MLSLNRKEAEWVVKKRWKVWNGKMCPQWIQYGIFEFMENRRKVMFIKDLGLLEWHFGQFGAWNTRLCRIGRPKYDLGVAIQCDLRVQGS